MIMNEKDVETQCRDFREMFDALRGEIGKVIVGHQDIVDDVLITLFSGGHVLLEGVPGLGKTLLVRTLSSVFSLEFRRIQFTPDLMPARGDAGTFGHQRGTGAQIARAVPGAGDAEPHRAGGDLSAS